MRQHHPDHNGNEKRAKEINAAYAILSDMKERKSYDDSISDKVGTMIGNFRVLEPIAEGGFGRTYKGEHNISKQPVCIKHCSMVAPEHCPNGHKLKTDNARIPYLTKCGYNVEIIWEHDIMKNLNRIMDDLCLKYNLIS